MLRSVAIALSIVLAGCIAAVEKDSAATKRKIERQEQALAAVENWYIQGKLAYRSGSEGGSGTIVWKRIGDSHKIDIFGGFGSNHLRITENADTATLADANGARAEGKYAIELLARHTGWRLPPNKLDAWIIGAPSRSYATEQKWSNFGYLTSFVQDEWIVHYSDYQYTSGLNVPARIQIVENESYSSAADANDDDFKKNIEVKFLIHNWGIN